MALYEFGSEKLLRIQESTFVELAVREREDLQRLLRKQVDVGRCPRRDGRCDGASGGGDPGVR